jgi:putative membrane protein
MTIILKHKIYLSIGLLWLFTVSGIFGILSQYQDWFLSLTPLNLMVYALIVLWNIEKWNLKTCLALFIPFFLGFVTEALGVNYGLIYGNYTYGGNLGYKVLGVPLMICVNWAVLTIASADIAKRFTKNIWISVIIGAALMTALDVILEVSAPRFDYWEFDGNVVPLQNYVGWFLTGFASHLGYQKLNVLSDKTISWHVFISIVVFFTVFLFV